MAEEDPGTDDSGGKLQTQARNLLNSGDAIAVVADFLNQTRTLRQQRRTLRQEVKDLTEKLEKAVPEGKEIVDKAEISAYRSLLSDGEKVDDLKNRIKAGSDAVAEVAKRKRSESFATAATALGYNPNVFEGLVSDKEVETEKVGDETKVYVVDGGKKHPAKEYMEQNFGDYLAALETKRKPEGPNFVEQPAKPTVATEARSFDQELTERRKSIPQLI